MLTMPRIKTRILILSDTHGHLPSTTSADEALSARSDFTTATTGYRTPLPAADVVLHCGDLTAGSKPIEFRHTLSMLRALRAPLKIVIPGNHDSALDAAFWQQPQQPGEMCLGPHDPSHREEALALLDDAKEDGVVYLGEQGAYSFPLANGAVLRIYASPHTPAYGVWGFQYDPDKGHDFQIPAGIDVAMTHGPPRDVLDTAGFDYPQYSMATTRAGCPGLFEAVARARPRVHCFGHIHEAWGAYRAVWKETHTREKKDTAEEAIDRERSKDIAVLADIKPRTVLDPPATAAQAAQLMEWSRQQGVHIDLEAEGERRGEETWFINAAIQGYREKPSQLPFVVDMMLDKAS